MIALFIAIMILANYLGILKHRRFDLTATGKFTLAPQTVKVVKGFKEPVKALCFFPDDIQYEANKRKAQDLLEEYRYFNKNFSFRFIDPESQPALARQHQIRQYGTIVFISGTRQKAVTLPTEQNFTNALLEVSGAQAKKIYFLTGNGEHDINSKDQDGYSEARMGLIRDLYQVQALNLTLNNEDPPGLRRPDYGRHEKASATRGHQEHQDLSGKTWQAPDADRSESSGGSKGNPLRLGSDGQRRAGHGPGCLCRPGYGTFLRFLKVNILR